MRAFSIRLAFFASLLFTTSLTTSLTASPQAYAFGRSPLGIASIRILSLQGNDLHIYYLHLPDRLRGQRDPTYTVQLVGRHGGAYNATVVGSGHGRLGCGSGLAVVRLPSNMPPDHYHVVVRNAYGELPAASTSSFYYVPVLGPSEQARLVFDTFGGQGKYDKMTYVEFKNSVTIEATGDVSFRQMIPAVWYCNGECWFEGKIYDGKGNLLSQFSQNTWASGNGFGPPLTFKKRIQMKRGQRLRFELRVRSTMSVGIQTSGRQTGWVKAGNLSHYLNGASHPERGGIRFVLIDMK